MFIIKEKNAPMYFFELSGSTEVIGTERGRAKEFASEDSAQRQIDQLDNSGKYEIVKIS